MFLITLKNIIINHYNYKFHYLFTCGRWKRRGREIKRSLLYTRNCYVEIVFSRTSVTKSYTTKEIKIFKFKLMKKYAQKLPLEYTFRIYVQNLKILFA
jgi:hypothetical protein